MFAKSLKRKQDTSTDLSQIQPIRKRLDELQEMLKLGVKETKLDTKLIMEYLDGLQDALDGNVRTLKISFSSVRHSDLESMGVVQRDMRFNDAAIQTRIAASNINSKHIGDLCVQINRIYRTVSRRLEAGARMLLDAVLLTLADISFDARDDFPVAIFPEMQIGSSDGVLVQNTKTKYSVRLTGHADYGVCTYRDVKDRNSVLGSALRDLVRHARNRIILIEAKRDKETLMDWVPEATSQAVALSELTGNQTVRYCLSDGSDWMFLAYTRDNEGNRISYRGSILSIMETRTVQAEFVKDVRHLVEVLYYWLRAESDIKNDPLCELIDDSTDDHRL